MLYFSYSVLLTVREYLDRNPKIIETKDLIPPTANKNSLEHFQISPYCIEFKKEPMEEATEYYKNQKTKNATKSNNPTEHHSSRKLQLPYSKSESKVIINDAEDGDDGDDEESEYEDDDEYEHQN
ncbi:unnamed protein product [Cunninghamella blakesleeana]